MWPHGGDKVCLLATDDYAALCLNCAFLLQAFGDAEKLVDGSITFVHAAKNALLDLDAWRLAQGSAGKLWKRQQQQEAADDTAESCDRWVFSCSLHAPISPSHPFECLHSHYTGSARKGHATVDAAANALPLCCIKTKRACC
jgi:hypothetical protein